MAKVDFFISHAFEDKVGFVRDLAQNLIRSGATVFYDEYSIKLGESLTQKINDGLATAKYGIVVISNFFFEKKWTNAELQAIFNKSVSEDFKIFIVYHNVTIDEVRAKYPLLADIKATNSSKGIEKITDEIFEAAGLKAQFGYMYTALEGGQGINIEDGFHVSLRLSIPFKGDPRIPKILLESGQPDYKHSRIRLVIKWNKRLYFEIVSENYQTVGISADIENWKADEPHIIIANCDTISKLMYLMIDGEIVDSFEYKGLRLPEIFFEKGRLIIGCSLDLEYPSSFVISGSSFGKSYTLQNSIDHTRLLEKFNKALGR